LHWAKLIDFREHEQKGPGRPPKAQTAYCGRFLQTQYPDSKSEGGRRAASKRAHAEQVGEDRAAEWDAAAAAKKRPPGSLG
jgi:hypothetical protein